MFLLIIVFAAITGLFRGVISGSALQSLIGAVFLPITALLTVFIVTSYCYFFAVVFHNRNLNFKRLSTLVFVAMIPTITIYTLSLIHPIITIIGITFSFLLLSFGLINRFQLNKKVVWISLGALFSLIFISWSINYFNLSSNQRANDFINQESQNILEKEFSN